MERVSEADFVVRGANQALALRVGDILGKAIYVLLLGLIVVTAIPYGTAEPWWKAFFICAVFVICIVALLDTLSNGFRGAIPLGLLIPLLAIVAFALMQSFSLGSQTLTSIPYSGRRAISADPPVTQFFALQVLALTLAAALLYRYVSNRRRMSVLIHVIISVVVISAIFGLLRQTSPHEVGALTPLLQPGQGYGQFTNANHFAYLMEMGLGITLGMIVGGGVTRERALIYIAALMPMWVALVLSNSRGGLLAMLVQLTAGAILFSYSFSPSNVSHPRFQTLSRTKLNLVRIVLLLALLAGVVWGAVWIGGDRLADKFAEGSGTSDRAAIARNDIWKATWLMFTAHPIAGVGMGGYWVAVHEHHQASGVYAPQEAHNDYLEILASGGTIGAALGIWFCVILVKRIGANLRSPDRFRRATCFGATLGIVGVACHSLFDFGLHKMINALIFIALVVIATSVGNSGIPERNET